MIVGVTGLIGHGKTYRAVRMAVELAQLRNAVLASNIRINVPGPFVQLPVSEDGLDVPFLMDLVDRLRSDGRGVVILVDEVGIIMPARWWSKFPIRFLFLLSQSRKMRADLIWTAQAPDQADKVLRDLTEYTDKVRAIPAPSLQRREAGKRPWVFRWTRWRGVKVDMTGQRIDECIDKGWERYRRETEGWYDTDEIVAPPARLLTDSRDESVARPRRGHSKTAGLHPPGTGAAGRSAAEDPGSARVAVGGSRPAQAAESAARAADSRDGRLGAPRAAREAASTARLADWRNRPPLGSAGAASAASAAAPAASLDQRT